MTYIDPSDMIKNRKLDDDELHLCKNPKNNRKDKYCIAEDDNYLYAASNRDMTGLTPSVAHDEYEAQSYEELFPYLPPLPPGKARTTPEASVAEGIHAEYRTEVTDQKRPKK